MVIPLSMPRRRRFSRAARAVLLSISAATLATLTLPCTSFVGDVQPRTIGRARRRAERVVAKAGQVAGVEPGDANVDVSQIPIDLSRMMVTPDGLIADSDPEGFSTWLMQQSAETTQTYEYVTVGLLSLFTIAYLYANIKKFLDTKAEEDENRADRLRAALASDREYQKTKKQFIESDRGFEEEYDSLNLVDKRISAKSRKLSGRPSSRTIREERLSQLEDADKFEPNI